MEHRGFWKQLRFWVTDLFASRKGRVQLRDDDLSRSARQSMHRTTKGALPEER